MGPEFAVVEANRGYRKLDGEVADADAAVGDNELEDSNCNAR